MKTSSDPRHLKREKIIQELFAYDAQTKLAPKDDQVKQRENWEEKTQNIIKNLKTIDQVISECAPEWEITKINQVDLAILRLAVYELVIEIREPTKVIIDEAVELAKTYGTESSPSFVNGALGKAVVNQKRIVRIIADKLGVEEKLITPEANLFSDLNATDLEVADLIANLEKDLDIPIDPNARFKTVSDITSYIEDRIE